MSRVIAFRSCKKANYHIADLRRPTARDAEADREGWRKCRASQEQRAADELVGVS
jgi:hypothetical protein